MTGFADRRPVPDPMRPRPLTIVERSAETDDSFTLSIDPGPGGFFPFTAGQFNMLYAFGVGEIAISISGDPIGAGPLVHTLRGVGSVSKAIDKLRPGDQIGVRGPFGTGWPVEAAVGKDIVLVAGGIGLAPLRPVVYHVLAQRHRFGRLIVLYGARTPEDVLYTDELAQWARVDGVEVAVTVDRATEDWRGNVGVVTRLIPEADFDPRKAVAMLCGPEVMMRFTGLELAKRGLRDAQIHMSLERNMKCAIGFCGHCQFGRDFVCRDGPVFAWPRIKDLFATREV